MPANLFAIYLMNHVGRKWTILFSLMFEGACGFICVALILVDGKILVPYSPAQTPYAKR